MACKQVALLLQRSLKHLQKAPQNNLDPELFAAIHKVATPPLSLSGTRNANDHCPLF